MSKIIRKSIEEAKSNTTQTDWEKIDQLDDAQIEQAIADDSEAAPILDEEWFQKALWVNFNRPASNTEKERISIRLDKDVLLYFRKQGKGYQSRINDILRAFIHAQQKGA